MIPTKRGMTPDLPHRAVRCKGWKWLAGMLAIGEGCCKYCHENYGQPMKWDGPLRVIIVDGPWIYLDHERQYILSPLNFESGAAPGPVPDLTDPATIGCLLALVRAAYDAATVEIVWLRAVAEVSVRQAGAMRTFASPDGLAAALVAALEGA